MAVSVEYCNLADVVAQLRAAGLVLESVRKTHGGSPAGEVFVESAKPVRCDTVDRPNKQSGAYRLWELRLRDGSLWLTGCYWIDHSPNKYDIELNRECAACGAAIPFRAQACPACGSTKRAKAREIPPEALEAHRRRLAEARREAQAMAEAAADRAAAWANAVWLRCREIGDVREHDYLVRKRLASAHGARLFENHDGIVLDGAEKEDYQKLARYRGALVVPMRNVKGEVRGLQFILSREHHRELIAARDGKDKDYWPRGLMNDGLHFVIGGMMHSLGLVAEGFATAASLHEATRLPVAVAFDAGGVGKVGELIWKARKKRINLLYCADDDAIQRCAQCGKATPVETHLCAHCGLPHGKGNAGVRAARDAALATAGAWVAPVFAKRPVDRKGPTDFNDLRCLEGEQPVRAQIEQKLLALDWRMPIDSVYVAGGNAGAPPPGGADRQDSGGRGNRERPDAVSIMSLDEVVERFIHIDHKKGGYVFDTWTREICEFSKVTEKLPARVRTDDVKDHPVWRARAVYLDQIGFDPAGSDPRIRCNMWDGWPTTPRQGSCRLLLELLEYQCGNEPAVAQELYRWVLRWLAYPIQHPGAKMQTAIIMHGPQGTGKGRFFEWGYMPIFGKYGVYLDQDALEDKHGSDWQSCKLFVLADEVLARAEMYHHKNKLKNLVTSRRIRINPKGLIAYEETNHLNIVFLSNEKQPLVLENDDRRYCVIWTPPPLGQDFYDELSEEIENGGVEALHYYLKYEVDLGDFKPWTRPPMTEAKRDLINMSRDSVDRFLRDWQAGDTDWPLCPCGSADLYRAYLQWCRMNGERLPRPENQFSGYIVKLPGWEKTYKDVMFEDEFGVRRPKRTRVVIPSPQALNEGAKRGKDYRQGAHETMTEWLTACFFEFRNALKVEL